MRKVLVIFLPIIAIALIIWGVATWVEATRIDSGKVMDKQYHEARREWYQPPPIYISHGNGHGGHWMHRPGYYRHIPEKWTLQIRSTDPDNKGSVGWVTVSKHIFEKMKEGSNWTR